MGGGFSGGDSPEAAPVEAVEVPGDERIKSKKYFSIFLIYLLATLLGIYVFYVF